MRRRATGPRPSKENEEEYEELKERLSKCRASEWQKAHAIFTEMCELCNYKGAKDGIGCPYPRACRYCHFYGHSTQFCTLRIEAEKRADDRETDRLLRESEQWRKTRQVTLPLRWRREFDETMANYRAACEAGLEGCTEDWDLGGTCSLNNVPLGQRCAGCEEWARFQCLRTQAMKSPERISPN